MNQTKQFPSVCLRLKQSVCGFPGKRRFNIKLWKTFTDCFNCLPIAAIIDEKIFCCHGGEELKLTFKSAFPFQLSDIICVVSGLSPDLQSMEQIRRIMRPTDVPDTGTLDSARAWMTYLFLIQNKSISSGSIPGFYVFKNNPHEELLHHLSDAVAF